MLRTLFATRSVGAEATTGLAANEHFMAVEESGGESPFDADPRATRPTQCEVVEEAVAECVSKPREGVGLRGEWVVPFSSGGYLRSFQRQRVSPAPDGASCENHPRIRPYLVVAPSGAAFWACYRAPTTALQPPLPRRGACARKVPTWRLNCRCPSARRRWRCASRFPTASPWGRGRRGRRSRPKPNAALFD